MMRSARSSVPVPDVAREAGGAAAVTECAGAVVTASIPSVSQVVSNIETVFYY
jgi:hypothetical protein